MTTHGARVATFCDTLPRSNPARRPWPRRPITIASTCSRRAVAMITSAGSPPQDHPIQFAHGHPEHRPPQLAPWPDATSGSRVLEAHRRHFLCARKLPHLVARDISANGQDGQVTSRNPSQLCRDFSRATGSRRTIRCKQYAPHRAPPFENSPQLPARLLTQLDDISIASSNSFSISLDAWKSLRLAALL